MVTPPFRTLRIPVALCLVGLLAAPASAGPPLRPQRPFEMPSWLTLGAEYRVESIYINPLDLNGAEFRETTWTEQRLRLDLGLRWPGIGGIYVQADILNGALFGDNGSYGGVPAPNSGLAIATKNPNVSAWEIGLKEGGDPLSTDSYGPVLRDLEPIQITHAWGEINLPVGIIRVGRMPMTEGANIAGHDGRRLNRWGVSRLPDVADRVLFATKIDAIVDVIRHGAAATFDPNPKNGILLAVTYDWNVQDSVSSMADDAFQVNVMLSWRREHAGWLGAEWRDFMLQGIFVHKGSETFDTAVYAFPIKFTSHIGPVYVNLQFSLITGHTREISDGLSLLSGKTPQVQDLFQIGAHALVEYRVGPVTFGLEFDYASGDDDPRGSTALTQFSFARDFNVGLLFFEHLLSFQTARAAAVGIENLEKLDSTSFPLTEVASQTRYQNAIGLFPQVKFDILEGPKHWLHIRAGVLAAWTAAGAVDPVATTLGEDGLDISDDAVNFHGGDPGSYWGTEVDLQIEWAIAGFFTWTVEGAVFVPGDAVEDEHGDAEPSFMVENRFVFSF